MKDFIAKLRPSGQRDGFNELIRTADAARDAGRWHEASERYAAALKARYDPAPILIQLGHAQKESGDFKGAERSYLGALALTPEDQDLLVQLGHFYNLIGEPSRAFHFYQQSIESGSNDQHARNYVEASSALADPQTRQSMQDPQPATQVAIVAGTLPACYLDVTDLVSYFKTNRSPTGVQRVEIELLKAALEWTSPTPIILCAYRQAAGAWVKVVPASIRTIYELAQQPGHTSDANWQATIGQFQTSLDGERPLDMLRGAALINLGPWWQIDYSLYLRHAKFVYGIRYVPLIYDIVPLVTPEFLPSKMPAEFAHWLSECLLQADAIAVISHCTERDVLKAAESIGVPMRRALIMPLDARFGSVTQLSVAERRRHLNTLSLTSGGFVLCVGTLEARKNHLLIVQAWARLIERHGADAVPTLVLAGKRGWGFEQAQMFLDTHPELSIKVMLACDTSDEELTTLYAECLFTVYTSTYEGWGLPVTESLSNGKACLTLDHSSLPEAGGIFADYSAASPEEFAEGAWHLINDAAYRTERETLIVTQFRPRDWHGVLDGLLTGVVEQLQSLPEPVPAPAPVTFGTVYEIRHNAALRHVSREQAIAGTLRHGQGWHMLEWWGVWTAARNSALAFRIPDLAGSSDDLLIFVEVLGPIEPVTLVVKLGLMPLVTVHLRPDEVRQLRLRVAFSVACAIVSAGGAATLSLNVERVTDLGIHNLGDTRQIGLGVKSFALCRETDTGTRLRMIERCQNHRQMHKL